MPLNRQNTHNISRCIIVSFPPPVKRGKSPIPHEFAMAPICPPQTAPPAAAPTPATGPSPTAAYRTSCRAVQSSPRYTAAPSRSSPAMPHHTVTAGRLTAAARRHAVPCQQPLLQRRLSRRLRRHIPGPLHQHPRRPPRRAAVLPGAQPRGLSAERRTHGVQQLSQLGQPQRPHRHRPDARTAPPPPAMRRPQTPPRSRPAAPDAAAGGGHAPAAAGLSPPSAPETARRR